MIKLNTVTFGNVLYDATNILIEFKPPYVTSIVLCKCRQSATIWFIIDPSYLHKVASWPHTKGTMVQCELGTSKESQ